MNLFYQSCSLGGALSRQFYIRLDRFLRPRQRPRRMALLVSALVGKTQHALLDVRTMGEKTIPAVLNE